MEPFVNVLKSANPDIISYGLQFIDMAFKIVPESRDGFEQAEGVACLEALEYNCNAHIAEHANTILDTYFMEEHDEGPEGGNVPNLTDDKMFTFWPEKRATAEMSAFGVLIKIVCCIMAEWQMTLQSWNRNH